MVFNLINRFPYETNHRSNIKPQHYHDNVLLFYIYKIIKTYKIIYMIYDYIISLIIIFYLIKNTIQLFLNKCICV